MPTATSIAERVTRIAKKVRDRGIRLGSPLTEHDVGQFERRHGVSLPEGYRSFLLDVGNGGAGPPEYGLAELGQAARDMSVEEQHAWSQLPHVREPFPFAKPWVWESGDVSNEGTSDQIHHGCIFAGNDGCGMYWYLIVTGSERGNVWMISGEGMGPTSPNRDFLKWYEDWLDGVRDWWA